MSGTWTKTIAAICGLTMTATQAFGQSLLPWRLADYPAGGEALASIVAITLMKEGDLIVPTCNALWPGTVAQMSSGVTGIAVSISGSDDENAALIVDGLPDCCRILSQVDIDTRISLGVAIALQARGLAETDLRSAQEIEFFVSVCEDDALSRSYELARGQDQTGDLIAEVDDEPDTPDIPVNPDPGGGLASQS